MGTHLRAVWSSEHLSVGYPANILHRHSDRITGISVVPGHHQAVFTNLITDAELRVKFLSHHNVGYVYCL